MSSSSGAGPPSPPVRVSGVILLALLVGPLAGCRREAPPPPTQALSAAAEASSPSRSPSPRGTTTGAAPDPRREDPAWQRAAGEDALERARLAEVEGASGLLEGLAAGGLTAQTALAALPYAADAELALGRLAELALTAREAELPPLLDALLAIAGRPPQSREPLDPEGARAAGEALLELARRAELPAPSRALAISAARALARAGYVDPARVPER